MKPSIAVIADPFERVHGGVENQARILFNMMKIRELNVTFIDYKDFTSRIFNRYEVLIIEGIHRVKLLKLFFSKKKSKKILFTHGSFYLSPKDRKELARKTQSKAFLLKMFFDRFFMKKILGKFNMIVTLSKVENEDLISLFKLNPRVLFDLGNFSDEIILKNDIAKYANEFSDPYVCYIGRIERRKNLLQLLKACHKLDIEFVLAGQDQGGLNELLSYCKDNNFEKFHYLGIIEQNKKLRIIQGSLAVVIPSYFEGLPTLALEAIKLGKHVILTKNSYMLPNSCVTISDIDYESLSVNISKVMGNDTCTEGYDSNDAQLDKLVYELKHRLNAELF